LGQEIINNLIGPIYFGTIIYLMIAVNKLPDIKGKGALIAFLGVGIFPSIMNIIDNIFKGAVYNKIFSCRIFYLNLGVLFFQIIELAEVALLVYALFLVKSAIMGRNRKLESR
jgi:hypothetical protein